jgi:hypothetical protein
LTFQKNHLGIKYTNMLKDLMLIDVDIAGKFNNVSPQPNCSAYEKEKMIIGAIDTMTLM